MTKLKTLKDFKMMQNHIEIDHYTLEALRQEAIKWYKYYCKEAQTHDTNYLLNKAEALEEFFNITEEDLKSKIKGIK